MDNSNYSEMVKSRLSMQIDCDYLKQFLAYYFAPFYLSSTLK